MSLSVYIQTYAQLDSANEKECPNPVTGKIAAIYIWDEIKGATVLLSSNINGLNLPEYNGHQQRVIGHPSEKEMLQSFWLILESSADKVFTFNGRKHLAPFLYLHSSANGIQIKFNDLLRDRYKLGRHIDLMEAFSFHNIVPNLNLRDLALFYQLKTPSLEEGDSLQALLKSAVSAHGMQAIGVWQMLIDSGVQHVQLIINLAERWRKTLMPIY